MTLTQARRAMRLGTRVVGCATASTGGPRCIRGETRIDGRKAVMVETEPGILTPFLPGELTEYFGGRTPPRPSPAPSTRAGWSTTTPRAAPRSGCRTHGERSTTTPSSRGPCAIGCRRACTVGRCLRHGLNLAGGRTPERGAGAFPAPAIALSVPAGGVEGGGWPAAGRREQWQDYRHESCGRTRPSTPAPTPRGTRG